MSYAPQVTLRWTLNVLVRFCRSLGRACFRSSRAKPTLSPPPIPIPIVLVPGNMGSGAKTASQLRAQGVNAVDAKLGPVSSCHDRACELFYALKGGRVDYGREHSLAHDHHRFGWLVPEEEARHPAWCEASPVMLLCHSQGALTALCLLDLLAHQRFQSHSDTSAAWVAGIVCIASPLSGLPNIHTLPLAGVPQAVEAAPGKEQMRQPVGCGIVALLIVLGYLLHVLQSFVTACVFDWWSLGWGDAFREHFWDWGLAHWSLSLRDAPSLLKRTHRLLYTTDTALHELTPKGVGRWSGAWRVHPSVFYVSMTCQITEGGEAKQAGDAGREAKGRKVDDDDDDYDGDDDDGGNGSDDGESAETCRASVPLPRHTASPFAVALAALNAATAPSVHLRDSDGLVPTFAQCHPPSHPHRRLSSLNPPDSLRMADRQSRRNGRNVSIRNSSGRGKGVTISCAESAGARQRALVDSLEPGVWFSGEMPWSVDHGSSQLMLGSPTLEYALQELLPAICEARNRMKSRAGKDRQVGQKEEPSSVANLR